MGLEEALARGMAGLARASARHAKLVVIATLLLSVGFAYGLKGIEVRSTDYDLMPDDHPSTQANERALNEVPGYRNVETVWVEVADPAHQNITDEASVRAMEEARIYVMHRIPELRYYVNLAGLVRIVNYTASGVANPATFLGQPLGPPTLVAPDMRAADMPNDTYTYQRDWGIVEKAAFDAVQAQVNKNFTGALLIFIYDYNVTKEGPEAVIPLAAKFPHVVQDYARDVCPNSPYHAPNGGPVYNCDHVYVLGQALNGHMTELAHDDFATWGPIVYVATLIVLALAFRSAASTLIALVSYTLGLVWVYGIMGYAHVPLTFFGLLIVPITLGVGKEYAIYVTEQLQEFAASGASSGDAAARMGRRAGVALLIASATSMAGLAVILFVPFRIMRELALLSIVTFGVLFLLAITFIPAAHALRPGASRGRRASFRSSRAMGGLARLLRRNRVAVLAVLAVATLGLAYESQFIEEYFGISGGFRQGDYVQESYQYYNQAIGGAGTELVVIEAKDPGGIGDPASLAYLDALDHAFKADTKRIPQASNVNSLLIGLRTYYNLRYGIVNPAVLDAAARDPNANIPQDKATINRDVKAAFDDPVWSNTVALFVGPDMNRAVTHVFYHIEREDFEGLEADWNALNHDVASVEKPASIAQVNLVGTQDTFYLYVKYGMPWLPKVTVVAGAITLVIALVIFRNARDVLAVVVPMALAGVWWAGLLPLFGIRSSLTLMLPTIFLVSVGSDYAIQYVWNLRESGDLEHVYATTGKANLYVVVATVVAFLLFVPMKLVLSSQAALAAALAILCIFVTTTLAVPLFYPEPATARVDLAALQDEELGVAR